MLTQFACVLENKIKRVFPLLVHIGPKDPMGPLGPKDPMTAFAVAETTFAVAKTTFAAANTNRLDISTTTIFSYKYDLLI